MQLPFKASKNILNYRFINNITGQKGGFIGQIGGVIHQCLDAQFHKLDINGPAGQIKITQLSCRIIKIIKIIMIHMINQSFSRIRKKNDSQRIILVTRQSVPCT